MLFQLLSKIGVEQALINQTRKPIRLRRFAAFYLAVIMALLSGCGGGSSSGDSTDASTEASTTEQGEVVLALTDAEGDFLSYTVDVQSISLEKANGTVVETVPINTRVDFTEYTDMTEFFTIATLPAGKYTKVNLNLDFSNADIVVQDAEGGYQSASVVDTEGDTVTNFTVQMNLSDTDVLTIRKGVPAKLTIDFDLDSSNTILSYDPAVVEVTPVILAEANLDADREHRSRGLLKAVDTELSTFDMALKPFRHHEGSFGNITLHSSDTTQYEINGEQMMGSVGLTVLATLAFDTPLIVYGTVSDSAQGGVTGGFQFDALYVLAGSSVPWVGRDVARGVVIARNEDVITLRGSHIERSNGSVTFHDNITVSLGAGTKVTRQALSNDGLTHDSVSIGQRVIIFGSLVEQASSDEANASVADTVALDATEGHVRLLMNVIKGEVVSLSPLTVDLRWINGRRVALFNFAGTGVTEEQDADPEAYEVNTESLMLDGLDLGSLIKVRGFPTAFGTAPEDFDAQTVIDINTENRAAVMSVRWQNGGSVAPFISAEPESLVLNVEDALYQVKLAGVPLDMVDGLQNDPVIEPMFTEGRGVYAVKVVGQPAVHVYKSFANYVESLTTHLSQGEMLKRMVALGRYDQSLDKMSSVVVTSRFVIGANTPSEQEAALESEPTEVESD